MRKFLILVSVIVISMLLPISAHAINLISTEMEIEIGRSVRDDVLDEYDEWTRPEDVQLVNTLTSRLLEFTTREGIDYEFHIIESDEINAFAAPGGFIFLTTGILDFTNRDPAMIAGVLAHEIGHVERKHGRDRMQDALLRQLGFSILLGAFDMDEEAVQIAAGVALVLVEQGYSREDEYDADRIGVKLTYLSGWYPSDGLISFLDKLDKEIPGNDDLGEVGQWFSSHPETARRVMFANEYLDEVSGDYVFSEYPLPEAPPPPDKEEEAIDKPESTERHVIWERK
ncbi:MAG TPA: M48 family metalloprotease [bacterium]|jgi:predicted Zn-dependent protease